MTAHRERLPRGSSAGPGVVLFSLYGKVVDRIGDIQRTFFSFIKPPPLLFFQRLHPFRQTYTLAGPSLMYWMTGKGGALTDRSAALIGPGECGSFCSPLFRRRIFRFIKKPDEFFFIRHRCPFDQWAPWGAPPPIRTGGVGLFVACEGQRVRQGINLHASRSSTTIPYRLRKAPAERAQGPARHESSGTVSGAGWTAQAGIRNCPPFLG